MPKSEVKKCISCGMPLREKSDYPLGDTSKDYCTYCARPDGSMKSYEEAKEGMTGFIMKTQGFDKKAAEKAAVEMMKKNPAWKQN